MSETKKKTNDPDADIVYQCLDATPHKVISVVQKKGSEAYGLEPINKALEKDDFGRYTIDGLLDPEVKELMVKGMERYIKKTGAKIVRLDKLSEGEAARVLEDLDKSTLTVAEKLQVKTLELAEQSETLEEAKERIKELEEKLNSSKK
jgi:hypothetical protein